MNAGERFLQAITAKYYRKLVNFLEKKRLIITKCIIKSFFLYTSFFKVSTLHVPHWFGRCHRLLRQWSPVFWCLASATVLSGALRQLSWEEDFLVTICRCCDFILRDEVKMPLCQVGNKLTVKFREGDLFAGYTPLEAHSLSLTSFLFLLLPSTLPYSLF